MTRRVEEQGGCAGSSERVEIWARSNERKTPSPGLVWEHSSPDTLKKQQGSVEARVALKPEGELQENTDKAET